MVNTGSTNACTAGFNGSSRAESEAFPSASSPIAKTASCEGPVAPRPIHRGLRWLGTFHGEFGEIDIPPVPGPNVPSGEFVSETRTPRLRLLGPVEGKPSDVGVIARKYSMVASLCSKT
jgi:hypothetical protein